MKILYINSLYSPDILGGAEISLKLIVEGMKARGHEVVVLALSPTQGMKSEQIDEVTVYRADLKNSYWPYSKAKKNTLSKLTWHFKDQSNTQMADVVSAILDREDPDIVSCHNLAGWSAAVWKPMAERGIPIVQVLHDLYLLCPNSNMFKDEESCEVQCLSCKVLRIRHAELSSQVAAVVGISNNILERFLSFGYFSNATKQVIYNTREIPLSPFPATRKKNQAIRFGYLGTLSKVKGLEWLIEQFNLLNFEASLYIAGKGEESYEKHLKEVAGDAQIKFVGYVDSNEFFKTIDVLIVPSLWEEPLGMVAIEALAHHLPVIANKRGGLQETVKDGVNGLYCNDQDRNSLSEAMQKLYDQPELHHTFSQAARESVAPILDSDRLIGEYELVLKNTLNDRVSKKKI
jgi:glycosyltransferase involved in cell wall biosynthesis